MVYFIQCTVTGRVKIGKAVDPHVRLQALQIGSPTPLRLLAILDGGRDKEREMHKRFKADRLHGEWFDLSDALRSFLSGAGTSPDIEQGIDAGPLEARFDMAMAAWGEIVNLVHLIHLCRWTPTEYDRSRTQAPFHVSGSLWADHRTAVSALKVAAVEAREAHTPALMEVASASD